MRTTIFILALSILANLSLSAQSGQIMFRPTADTINVSALTKLGDEVELRSTKGSRVIVETRVSSVSASKRANQVLLDWVTPVLVENKLEPANGSKYLEYVNGVRARTYYVLFVPEGTVVI